MNLTIRRMMVVVAVLALASLAGREIWNWWTYRPMNLAGNSYLGCHLPVKFVMTENRAPVPVQYDLHLTTKVPPPGTSFLFLGSVWLEDLETKTQGCGYTFDVRLTVGERERAQDSFVREAVVLYPGRSMLHHKLAHVLPTGENSLVMRGYTVHDLVTAEPTSGAQP